MLGPHARVELQFLARTGVALAIRADRLPLGAGADRLDEARAEGIGDHHWHPLKKHSRQEQGSRSQAK